MKLGKHTSLLPLLLLLALLPVGSAVSAADYYLLDRAESAYQQARYTEAITLYEQAYAQDPTYEIAGRLAESYNNLRSYEKALQWSDQLQRYPQHTPFDEARNLQLQLYNGKYAQARQSLKRSSGVLPEDAAFIRRCIDSAERWVAVPDPSLIRRQDQFNTAGSDFGLVVNPRGGFALCSDAQYALAGKDVYQWTGRGYLNIFRCDSAGKNLQLFLGDQADARELNIGSISFSQDGKEIFYSTSVKGKSQLDLNGGVRSQHVGIYHRKLQGDGRWSAPEAFPYNDLQSYSMGDPWLSADGKRLYFVSDFPYGLGNTDIFYSDRAKDGSFGIPTRLEHGVNTQAAERFPRFDTEGNFYFSSAGREGMGGLDVFRVRVKDGRWGQPHNLRYPFNSPQDDFAPVFLTPTRGYFSSNRKGGKGEDDIYYFEIAPLPDEPDSAPATPSRGGPGSPTAPRDSAGKTDQVAPRRPTDPGSLIAGRDGSLSAPAALPGVSPEAALGIKDSGALKAGSSFRLANVYYDYDRWDIRPEAAAALNQLVALLGKYPRLEVEIQSHTDSRGTPKYNQTLSQLRAQSVVRYLVAKGVNPARLQARGFGADRPVVKCTGLRRCTEADYQQNRRTEFVITKD